MEMMTLLLLICFGKHPSTIKYSIDSYLNENHDFVRMNFLVTG
jgi:hypothetical protein